MAGYPEDETRLFEGPATYRGQAGVLTVTDGRVRFTRIRGLVAKKATVRWEVPLARVLEVEGSSTATDRRIAIVSESATRRRTSRAELEVEEPATVLHVIEQALAEHRRTESRRGAGSPAGSPTAVHVTINAPTAPTRVMVRCPYCRSVYPETDGKCPSCGAHF